MRYFVVRLRAPNIIVFLISLLFFLLTIGVSWPIKLSHTKKLILKLYWGKIILVANGTTNNIPENFSAMRFRIKVRKLHV